MGEWRGLGGEDEEERERVRVEERIFLFIIIRIFTSRPRFGRAKCNSRCLSQSLAPTSGYERLFRHFEILHWIAWVLDSHVFEVDVAGSVLLDIRGSP